MVELTLAELTEHDEKGTLIGAFKVSIDDYHAGPGVSKSQLDKIAKSPLQFWHSEANPTNPTKAMILGSATDTYRCSQKEFDENYLVIKKISRSTTAGKTYWAEQSEKAEAEGRTILCEEPHKELADLKTIKAICHALAEHPVASNLTTSGSQVSFYWKDAETGLLCKCRPDFMPVDGVLVDLKVTHDPSPNAFKRSIGNYRYHAQDAFYIEGVNQAINQAQLSIALPSYFVFVAVQSEAPYDIGIYRLPEQARQLGTDCFRKDLRTYKECSVNDRWPGLCTQIIDLDLPAWTYTQQGGNNE